MPSCNANCAGLGPVFQGLFVVLSSKNTFTGTNVLYEISDPQPLLFIPIAIRPPYIHAVA